jgi:FixJ family two-component response regulator
VGGVTPVTESVSSSLPQPEDREVAWSPPAGAIELRVGPRPRVIVVDGDPGFRRSTERLLRSRGFEVEGYAHPARFLERPPEDLPACLLLELAMPGMSGLEVQDELARRGSSLPVVFLSGRPDLPGSVQAMKRGAVDCLLKPLDPRQLLEAIQCSLRRDERARAARAAQQQARERLRRLTVRELQVCDGLMRGMLNKQMAAALGLAESTVKVHRSRMMKKLGLESVVGLVRLMDQAFGPATSAGPADHELARPRALATG